MEKKQYIVVSGCSGVGKTTVLKRIREERPELLFSVSWTTRPPRPEEDASAYTFVSTSQFEEGIRADAFLEWICKDGDYYGTPKQGLTAGKRIRSEEHLNSSHAT